MKRVVHCIIVAYLMLLICPNLFGQDYQIKLTSRTIEAGAKMNKRLKSSDFKDLGKYFLIQFKEIPDAAARQALYESGIELIEYIPENAYLARKHSGQVRVTKSAGTAYEVLRVEEYKPEYKLDYRIVDNDIPKWATPELGKIRLTVVLFKDTEIESGQLVNMGVTDITKKGEGVYEMTVSASQLEKLSKLEPIKWMELAKPERVLHTKNQRTMHRANVVNSDIINVQGLDGQGVIIGEMDGGEVYPHQDLYTNLTVHTQIGYSDHSTHVAGSIIGKGLIDPEVKGVASKAQLHSWDFYVDNPMYTTDSAITAVDLNLVTNSWGFGFSPYYCYSPAPYGVYDQEYDKIAQKHPKVLQMFSSGNDRESCSGGYMTALWNMKNVLYVGALDNQEELGYFSSCGPLFDGRIVPHIVGMGVDVYSTELYNRYMNMSGTSMSTPGVTGCVALLYQAYKQNYNEFPNSSLAKALVCNTAKDLGNPGPDYQYGFGRIDIQKAVESVNEESFFESEITNGSEDKHFIDVDVAGKELKVTLVWTDVPAHTGAATALVDNLDLVVITPSGEMIYPLVLDPSKPSSPAFCSIDKINNIEQVVIKEPTKGRYQVIVKGTKVPTPITYSVAYYLQEEELALTSPIGEELFKWGAETFIRWNSTNLSENVDLYISHDNGSTWSEIAKDLPANSRNYSYSIPANLYSNTNKIKVVQGGQTSQSESFTIAPAAGNLSFEAGYETARMMWSKVPGAESYNVYQIKGGELHLLETVQDTFYQAKNLKTNTSAYFALSSEKEGVIAPRSVAKSVVAIPNVDLALKGVVAPLSGQVLGEDEAITIRLQNNGAALLPKGTKLPLSYNLNGAGKVEEICELENDLLPGKELDFTFSNRAYMAVPKYYGLEIELNHPDDTVLVRNNTLGWEILYHSGITEYPYKQTFDGVADLNSQLTDVFDHIYLGKGWENEYLNDDFEWWPWSSDTYKDGSGPSEDHTSGAGKFLYTESDFLQGRSGKMDLYSPYFNINSLTNPFVSFWYHMFAQSMEMGTLSVDLYCKNEDKWYESIWSKSGSQGNKWQNTLLDLSSYKGKGSLRFRFRVVTSDNNQNAIAIDDFELYEGNIFDLKLDSVAVDNRTIQGDRDNLIVYYTNIGGKDIPAGEKVKFSYVANDGESIEEELVLQDALQYKESGTYEFLAPLNLSDLTKRNLLDIEISFLRDAYKGNNRLRNVSMQKYNEPESLSDAGYYYLGLMNFYLQGIYPEASIENFNTHINNTEIPGYSFYGKQIAKVYRGKEYQVGVQPIPLTKQQGLDPMGQYVKVWIDFNQDGYFAPEEAIIETDHRGIAYQVMKFKIPEGASLGKTRVRARTTMYREDLSGADAGSKDYSYGETEDYTLDIIDEPEVNVALTEFLDLPVTFDNLGNQIPLKVKLQNVGITDVPNQSALNLYCDVNGEVFHQTFTNETALNKGDNIVLAFDKKLDLSSKGNHIIKVWVDYEGDGDQYNDTLNWSVVNLEDATEANYRENFERANAGWYAIADDNKTVWELGTPEAQLLNTAHSGTSCWGTVLNGNYLPRNEAILYSPVYNFGKAKGVQLSFWVSTYSEPNFDGLVLEYSEDGKEWVKIGDQNTDFYNTEYRGNADLGILFWSDYSEGWKKREINVDELAGKRVAFRFRFYSDENQVYEGALVDDFEVITDGNTGVDDVATSAIAIYPNPCQKGIHIDLPKNKNGINIQLIDMNGLVKIEKVIPAVSKSYYLDLSDIGAGVYMLKCINSNAVYTQQVIKL